MDDLDDKDINYIFEYHKPATGFVAKSVDWDSCWEFVVASALFKLLDSFNGMFELEILELGASATLTNEFSTSTVSFHCTF